MALFTDPAAPTDHQAVAIGAEHATLDLDGIPDHHVIREAFSARTPAPTMGALLTIALDVDGTVIDRTWDEPESRAYLGVEFSLEKLLEWADWAAPTERPPEWAARKAWHLARTT